MNPTRLRISRRKRAKIPSEHGRRPTTQGFSLIELLTVIAIVGILTALTIVGLGRVRESSRGAACMAELRQMVTACQLYTSDNRGVLIPIARGTGPADAKTWRALLIPFIGVTPDAMHCPSDPGLTLLDDNGKGVYPSSYGINKTVALHEYLGADLNKGITHVVNPSATVFITDIGKVKNPAAPASQWITSDSAKSEANFGYGHFPKAAPASGEPWHTFPRHNGRMNAAFYDGHVARVDVDRQIIPYAPGDPLCIYDNK